MTAPEGRLADAHGSLEVLQRLARIVLRKRELGELVRRDHTFDARARQIAERVAELRKEHVS